MEGRANKTPSTTHKKGATASTNVEISQNQAPNMQKQLQEQLANYTQNNTQNTNQNGSITMFPEATLDDVNSPLDTNSNQKTTPNLNKTTQTNLIDKEKAIEKQLKCKFTQHI